MSFPPEIQNLLDALQALPGIKEIDIDLPTGLEDIKTDDLSLPGPFAELPHAALRRTKGGLEKEVLLQIFFELEATSPAHKSLELIAWIIRDWARSGTNIQLRARALPVILGGEVQTNTLQFCIEWFHIDPNYELASLLDEVKRFAETIADEHKEILKISPSHFDVE